MKFNFSIGKKERGFWYFLALTVTIKPLIAILSKVFGLTEKDIFNIIDEIQLQSKTDFLNDYIIKDTKYLQYRNERVVDRAIEEYIDEVGLEDSKVSEPIFTETNDSSSLLGGEMRLTAPWKNKPTK